MSYAFLPTHFRRTTMMPGLFDEQFLLKKLDQKVDPLARLNSIVDWQCFLPIIEQALGRDKASAAGRKPYPSLFMFKILILQSLYNQSDEETERFLLRDLLARRFVGLCGKEFGPDFTTIWRFKEALSRAGVLEALHDAFSKQLDELGFQASKGQIVDAKYVREFAAKMYLDKAQMRLLELANWNFDKVEEISTRKKNSIQSLMNAIENGIGQNMYRGTKLWLLNGWTTYLHNVKTYKSPEQEFTSLIGGTGMKGTQSAYDLLMAA